MLTLLVALQYGKSQWDNKGQQNLFSEAHDYLYKILCQSIQ